MSALPTMPTRFEHQRTGSNADVVDRPDASDAETITSARSACYSFVSVALNYPGDELVGSLLNDETWESLLAMMAPLRSLRPRLQAVRETALKNDDGNETTCSELQSHLESAYCRLFSHTAQGSMPLYELAYGNRDIVQQAPELADITGFYGAFGVQIAEAARERPDHVAVECEFMALLTAKEKLARQQSPEFLDLLQDAQRSFLAQHLGWWLPALAGRLRDADPAGFYGAVASCISDFMALEAAQLHVEIGPKYLAVRPVDPSLDAAISCEPGQTCPGSEPQELVQLTVNGS